MVLIDVSPKFVSVIPRNLHNERSSFGDKYHPVYLKAADLLLWIRRSVSKKLFIGE
jgi:hypothetical protein